MVKLLTVFPFDHNVQDNEGRTALWYAMYYKQLAVFNALLRAGAAAQVVANGHSALCIAAQEGLTDFVAVLLERCASAALCEADGTTPLMHTAWCSDRAMARMPLNAEADAHATNTRGEGALLYATMRNDGTWSGSCWRPVPTSISATCVAMRRCTLPPGSA